MFVAWRDLRSARGRFALMGTVVILMTLLVVMLSGLTAGLGKQSTSAITGLSADHITFAVPSGSGGPSFTESMVTQAQWQQLAKAPGVRSAHPLGITSVKASTTGDARTAGLSAFGVQPTSGIAPGPVSPGSVVLSTGAAEALSVSQGDQIVVSGRALTVAAVAGDASFSHTPVVWMSLVDWQRLSPGAGDRATVVAVTTDSTSSLAATDKRLGTDTIAKSDSLAAIGSYSSENGSLQMMRGLLFAISALVIGAFFTVWTIQRSRDIAILKALGATTRYLLRDALGQAVVLLVGGTLVGSALAAGLGALASGTVPFVLSASTVLFPAAVMIALGAVGAALSVRRITSVDPLTALSGH
ncbi:MAG: ABC transporter permease [Actinomycetota bacterium]|nr:ABC transporter permease [Actinomycetota bacterium]